MLIPSVNGVLDFLLNPPPKKKTQKQIKILKIRQQPSAFN